MQTYKKLTATSLSASAITIVVAVLLSGLYTSARIYNPDGNTGATLTAGDGLTRTGDDFDCDTANAETFGCLSSADWTLFNESATTTLINDTSPELGGILDARGNAVRIQVPAADGRYDGTVATGVAATTIAFGDLLFYNTYSGRYDLADADTVSTVPAVAVAISGASAGNDVSVLLEGLIYEADWNWTVATTVRSLFVSTTAGDFSQNAPNAATDQIQSVGVIVDADTILFRPDLTYVEVGS